MKFWDRNRRLEHRKIRFQAYSEENPKMRDGGLDGWREPLTTCTTGTLACQGDIMTVIRHGLLPDFPSWTPAGASAQNSSSGRGSPGNFDGDSMPHAEGDEMAYGEPEGDMVECHEVSQKCF